MIADAQIEWKIILKIRKRIIIWLSSSRANETFAYEIWHRVKRAESTNNRTKLSRFVQKRKIYRNYYLEIKCIHIMIIIIIERKMVNRAHTHTHVTALTIHLNLWFLRLWPENIKRNAVHFMQTRNISSISFDSIWKQFSDHQMWTSAQMEFNIKTNEWTKWMKLMKYPTTHLHSNIL